MPNHSQNQKPKEFKSSRDLQNPRSSAGSLGATIGLKLKGWKTSRDYKRSLAKRPSSFKLQKREKLAKTEKTTTLIGQSLRFIGEHWKTLGIITLFYIGSYAVLAYATPKIDIQGLFSQVDATGNTPGILDKARILSSSLFTYRGDATSFARWAQFLLAVLFSLIFIYAIRKLHQGSKIRARDALYSGTENLIPFLINLSLFAIQLIPFTLLSVIYSIGRSRNLFINSLEQFGAVTVLILAGLLTFWFIPSTIMSMYAVTVPGVYPARAMEAISIAVSRRRLEIVKNLFVFLVFIFVTYLTLLLLLATYIPRFAGFTMDLFFLLSLPVIHVMLYKLYLKLLDGNS